MYLYVDFYLFVYFYFLVLSYNTKSWMGSGIQYKGFDFFTFYLYSKFESGNIFNPDFKRHVVWRPLKFLCNNYYRCLTWNGQYCNFQNAIGWRSVITIKLWLVCTFHHNLMSVLITVIRVTSCETVIFTLAVNMIIRTN